MVEWQDYQCSEDHLCPYHQEPEFPDTRDRDGPQNVGLPTIQPPSMIVSCSVFYGIQSLWKLEIICYKGGLYQGCQDFLKLWEPPQNYRYQNAKMKQVPYLGTTNIRCHHIKSCLCDLPLGMFAPLFSIIG